MKKYPHLGLRRWPFPVAPDLDFCDFIADRNRLQSDIEGLLTALARQNASSIHLLWSWYGAGKTHTLFYIINRVREMRSKGGSGLCTVYSEFPKSSRSFLDLYRSFMRELPIPELAEAYLQSVTSTNGAQISNEVFSVSPDLANVLQVLNIGKLADQTVATRWLRGDALPLAEFRRIGAAQRIANSEEAVRILATIIRLFAKSAECENRLGGRTIWLLDEFQRIGKLPKQAREEISTGLHSLFNTSPTNFGLMLSFSGRPRETLPDWLSIELRDRIGRAKVLLLPPMLEAEGLQFVHDILKHLRLEGFSSANSYFPFLEETCRFIISEVHKHGELKPRAIMHAFTAVLQVAEPKLETGQLQVITSDLANRVLQEHTPVAENEEGEQ